MKKYLPFVLLILCALTAPAQQWLVLGFDDWPPFTGKDGSPRVAVRLLTEALERLDYKVDMIPLRPGQFEQVFTNKTIQISPALWHDESRDAQMIFSKPIFENRLVLVGNVGSGAKTKKLEDLAGKKLGVVQGYAYGDRLTRSPAEQVKGKSDSDLMKKLIEGEVDYILTSDLLMVYAKRSLKKYYTHEVEVGEHPQITRELHFAIKRDVPNAEKIMKQLNAEVEKMKVDGRYYEILGINRIIVDVNGDGKPEVLLRGDPANTLNPDEVFYMKDTDREIPETDMEQWYMVEGKFYKTLEEIPADKRKRMNKMAEKQIEFLIEK